MYDCFSKSYIRIYLCNFYDVPNIYRNTLFEQYFYFTCNCVACERNWPPLLNFIQIEQKFINTSRSFLETKFIEENKELLTLIHKKDAKFNENIIQDLVKAIEKASKILPQPCSIKCILTFSLQMVFEKLYGYNTQIFDNCQSRIKP
ncbi:PREDICTED: uncharacterized protein LOC105366257 [Ceratosolen solmsi marchali]|uniref:Uncharacterized protein LOC105366257 n=1 Tax=Ceratosolen solmsi marchali TaxID=326594 RepID=A0AAJ6YRK0_9HYME|nr:PREDICTED: uncharacterized protein LOC105366257 [Ceratosolen solmsi marchali]